MKLLESDITSDKINSVAVNDTHKNITYNIKPKFVIDCTGNGSVVKASGHVQKHTENCQMSAVTIVIETTSAVFSPLLALQVPYFLNEAVENGRFDYQVKFSIISHGENENELNLKISINTENISYTDIRHYSENIFNYLCEKVKDFQGSAIKEISPEICHREETCLNGKYTLTENDIITGAKFDDECVKGSWAY